MLLHTCKLVFAKIHSCVAPARIGTPCLTRHAALLQHFVNQGSRDGGVHELRRLRGAQGAWDVWDPWARCGRGSVAASRMSWRVLLRYRGKSCALRICRCAPHRVRAASVDLRQQALVALPARDCAALFEGLSAVETARERVRVVGLERGGVRGKGKGERLLLRPDDPPRHRRAREVLRAES